MSKFSYILLNANFKLKKKNLEKQKLFKIENFKSFMTIHQNLCNKFKNCFKNKAEIRKKFNINLVF